MKSCFALVSILCSESDRYLRMSTRREFLKLMGKGMAFGSCLPMLTSCESLVSGGRLPFFGEVVGEDIGLCHELRDGTLSAEAGGS